MKPILIVDDDEVIREMVMMLLENEGWQVRQAGSGQECLNQLRQGFRGLILMDIRMPGMDGWETVRAIAQEGLFTGNLIYMVTGEAKPNLTADGLQEYVLDYLVKPFHPGQLVKSVRQGMDLLLS
jgi:CheY-like chemotaxis protein